MGNWDQPRDGYDHFKDLETGQMVLCNTAAERGALNRKNAKFIGIDVELSDYHDLHMREFVDRRTGFFKIQKSLTADVAHNQNFIEQAEEQVAIAKKQQAGDEAKLARVNYCIDHVVVLWERLRASDKSSHAAIFAELRTPVPDVD